MRESTLDVLFSITSMWMFVAYSRLEHSVYYRSPGFSVSCLPPRWSNAEIQGFRPL